MVPAIGLISLVWTLSCLVLSGKANLGTSTECCRCKDLMPDNPKSTPQIMPSPFKIEVEEDMYSVGREIHVNLRATEGRKFRSFILGAYPIPYIADRSKPVGRLTLLDNQDFDVGKECFGSDGQPGEKVDAYALASRDKKPKSNLRFSWISNNQHGHVEFRATFVEDDNTYWASEKSAILPQFGSNRPLPKAFYHSIPPISTKECGDSKGCYREPADCVEPQCTYLVTWKRIGQELEFEMGGLSDGAADRYMAVGFSHDKYMGDETVLTCAHDSETQTTEVYAGYNQDDPRKHVPVKKYAVYRNNYNNAASEYNFISKEEGSYENGRLRCRFTIKRDLGSFSNVLKGSLLGEPKRLLLWHGYAKHGAPERLGMDVQEIPQASEDKIDLNENGNHDGRASYPLAKAHGILMIIAWVLFSSIASMLIKYYKTMWPNSRWYDRRYWFVGHFNLMAMVVLLTIIGFILIFIEAGGYTEAPDLPQRAHPILGIIIFVCILIIPFFALIRPSEDSKCRPVFNWFYWLFLTIANVLAIPQIFIGMDFGKVMIPWWATWILVIWVIFHIIVELSLEIHQCCTYKKNKERRKKWEQLKREYPKQHHPEPEPAGRRFKRFMLFLHVSFTILITLIMVIIIAVC